MNIIPNESIDNLLRLYYIYVIHLIHVLYCIIKCKPSIIF